MKTQLSLNTTRQDEHRHSSPPMYFLHFIFHITAMLMTHSSMNNAVIITHGLLGSIISCFK